MASIVIKLFTIFVLIEISVSEGEVENKVAKQTISDDCLNCMCDALSNCLPEVVCNDDLCDDLSSYYGITQPYWVDAGKPTVSGQSSEASDAYQKCSVDPHCAAQTVRGYMKTFEQDCNDDGKIDCLDYMAIHMKGGFNCKGNLTASYLETFKKCITLKRI